MNYQIDYVFVIISNGECKVKRNMKMKFIMGSIVLLLIVGMAMLCVAKIVEYIINLATLSKDDNYYNVAKQRNGIVYNKKSKKLEADQSIILPFE